MLFIIIISPVKSILTQSTYLINTKEISVTILQLTFVIQGKPPASYPFIYTCHRKLWHNCPPSAASPGPAGSAFTPGALQQVTGVLRNLLGGV